MARQEIEIVIRGGGGDDAYGAAHIAGRALKAEGARVDLRSISWTDAPEPGALRGATVRVRVDDGSSFTSDMSGGGRPAEVARGARPGAGIARAAKIGIGVVLLLMLFGAEIRLHFGLRLGSIVTLVAIWIFWLFALRRADASS